MLVLADSFFRTMSETIEDTHAFDDEDGVAVVATTTLAGFALGFGLGATFVVGINRGRGSGALFQ